MLSSIIFLGFLGQVLIYGGLLSYVLSYHIASFKVPKKISFSLMVIGGILFWVAFLITPIIK
ncbi:putative membrane-bound protein [Bacillus phage vB_BsuM-Goe10]|nr:putative membrane-bound protein [Bacillus phage vB_BsuM-Goe10]